MFVDETNQIAPLKVHSKRNKKLNLITNCTIIFNIFVSHNCFIIIGYKSIKRSFINKKYLIPKKLMCSIILHFFCHNVMVDLLNVRTKCLQIMFHFFCHDNMKDVLNLSKLDGFVVSNQHSNNVTFNKFT